MHRALQFFCLFLAAGSGLLALAAPAWSLDDGGEILVGRITAVEGELLRYLPEGKNWVQTSVDAPFGLEDALYSGEGSRAEFIFPNNTWMRIGANTQVQMVDLVSDATTVDLASGQARLYNRSRTAIIKATTPFGAVVASADAVFDLLVNDESLVVFPLRGAIEFVHQGTGQRYSLREGESALVADPQTVRAGSGTPEPGWDAWNSQREALWDGRMRSQDAYANLLPEPLRYQAYTLEENGRWERVYYNGGYRDMWRPTRVAGGWQPYTVGSWVEYYGDNCWIPAESFGYLTHHYGSWVYVDTVRSWYWMPPTVRASGSTSGFLLGFSWYPGRVAWFSRGTEIGWIPLAPNEYYYGYRHWGYRTKVISRHVPMINLARYRYLGHASVVGRDQFYRQHRFSPGIRRDLHHNQAFVQFQPITDWSAFKTERRRVDAQVRGPVQRPETVNLDRVRHNQQRSQAGGRHDRQRIEQDLRRAQRGEARPAVDEGQGGREGADARRNEPRQGGEALRHMDHLDQQRGLSPQAPTRPNQPRNRMDEQGDSSWIREQRTPAKSSGAVQGTRGEETRELRRERSFNQEERSEQLRPRQEETRQGSREPRAMEQGGRSGERDGQRLQMRQQSTPEGDVRRQGEMREPFERQQMRQEQQPQQRRQEMEPGQGREQQRRNVDRPAHERQESRNRDDQPQQRRHGRTPDDPRNQQP
nr:DUF6600 domain-containing protein [uncultured Desulfobulbus sp.]